MTEMPAQEPHQLAGHLQPRHIRVQQQPIDTLDLERHMTLEHVVDVRHARHRRMVTAEGGLRPPGLTDRTPFVGPPRVRVGGGYGSAGKVAAGAVGSDSEVRGGEAAWGCAAVVAEPAA